MFYNGPDLQEKQTAAAKICSGRLLVSLPGYMEMLLLIGP